MGGGGGALTGGGGGTLEGDGGGALEGDGVPITIGAPQRAAAVEAQLFRGTGVHHPDTVLDHGVIGDLVVRAASVRGTYARYNGTARQDDYAMGCSADGRMMVVAVADGLSNAEVSHVGATLAARTAVQQTVRLLDEGQDRPDMHGVFQSAAYQLQRAAEQMVERGQFHLTASDDDGSALATTLIVAVMPTAQGPRGDVEVQLARVGDSNAWMIDDGGWVVLMGAKGDPGAALASSQVRALPGVPDSIERAIAVLPCNATFIIATDGITDPFGSDLEGQAAEALAHALHPTLPPVLEFARVLAFRGQSWDDDRTAIAIRCRGAAPGDNGRGAERA